MITRLSKPVRSVILCTALSLTTTAFAQDTSNPPKPAKMAATGGDEHPDLIEIDPFGGISLYGQLNRGLTMHTADGGVGGLRIAVNPSRYVGIELWADYAAANISFLSSTAPGVPAYSFGSHNFVFGLNPVLNLKPRGSWVQPYLTAGVMGTQFTPSNDAQFQANTPQNAAYGAQALSDNLQVGFNYGGGVKWHFTDHFGARFDVRGLLSRAPTFGLPSSAAVTSGVYIPAKQQYNGLQATLGLVFFAGTTKCPPMPAAPAPPAPLPTPTITGMEGQICQGKPVMLHATLPGASTDHKLTFAWTVNGQAQDSTTSDLNYTPTGAGSVNVQVTVTDTTPPPAPMERPKKFPVRCWIQPPPAPPVAPVSATATLTVADTTPTISSVTASPTELACAANNGTHTATLTGTAAPAACGGTLTYKWSVSEGSVTNDSSANATFDASSLNFEGGAQAQSKSVTATLTVTDPSGKTASQNTTISVKCDPGFVRLDDVVYAKNNARVNNCGKRLLIDDAASRMASGDYDIVLVGHRDTDESGTAAATRGKKSRKAAPASALDEQRVLNAAAVLSGGTGTCGKVDPSRIKVDWVGTDQTSETRPGQCGTSGTKATERKGSEVSEADKNRRVEVYLVPHNSTTLPPAVKAAKALPEGTMKSLACPK